MTHLDGIPIVITADVPLDRTRRDGTRVPALCWRRGDEVHVHPKRWEEFERVFGDQEAA